MSRRVQCKFFADGACLKGERCEFLHNQKDPQYKVCTYYQKGICSYGSRCKFAHVKSSRWRQSASSSSSVPRRSSAADSVPIPRSSRILAPGGSVESSILTRTLSTSDKCEDMGSVHQDLSDKGKNLELANINPEEQPICPYAAAGDCPIGELCPHIHGEACPTCGKHCLHPFRPQEREEHMITCEKNQKQLEALKNSQEIECCVCMEPVLAKPSPAERKFGLLTECDHSFCISCIRNWRNSSPSIGMDVNSTLRACPICRKLSYFVVPSPIWYSTPEEKAEIIDNYKTKLRSIDCKHFNFGNGNCPFGKICFYKHTVKPGSYTWKYNRPPPRLPHRPPRNVDVSELFSMFEDGISEDEFDPFGFADMDYYDDDDEDDFSPFDVAMLLMNLDLESDNAPSDEDYVYPF